MQRRLSRCKSTNYANDANHLEEPKIIYEDENFLAVDKPAGLLVHRAGISNSKFLISKQDTLVNWLSKHYPEIKKVGDDPEIRPGIVHRLDRETSGIMLIAKNQKYFEYLKSLFKSRQIKKIYLALVFGRLKTKQGLIEKPIGIKPGTVKRSIYSKKLLKSAATAYRVKKEFQLTPKEIFSLLEVMPQTGRTHQIRVHLSSIGHPVVGDQLYGPKKQPKWAYRLLLHALSLEFSPSPGRRLKIEAMPTDISRMILRLFPHNSHTVSHH